MQSKINCPECNEPYTVIPNCGIICFNCWEFVSKKDIEKEIIWRNRDLFWMHYWNNNKE